MSVSIQLPNSDPAAAIIALVESGKAEAAEREARDWLAREPDSGPAWRALGYVLLHRNNDVDAEAALRRALAIEPRDKLALEHLGWLLHRCRRLPETVAALKACLAIDPDRVRARVILGNTYIALGKPRRAIAHFERALALSPKHFRAHNNLANALVTIGQLKSAVDHFAAAARYSPELTYQVGAAHQARRIGDWSTAEELEPKFLATLRGGTRPTDRIPPFPLLAVPGATSQDFLLAGRQFARSQGSPTSVPHTTPAELADGKLRIGYLSPDFYNQWAKHLFTDVPEFHNRARFEIVAFDYGSDLRSEHRKRALAGFDQVVSVRALSDQEVAQRIAAERIAVAVDLTGWSTGSRSLILAHRPAPVTVQWLGYPGTLGASWVDYIVADPQVAPRGCEGEFSEKLLRLPHCYFPNDRSRPIGAKLTRAEAGLPDDAFVFCCFNQAFKLNREHFALWMDLLRARPGSVLWLLDDNRWATEALRARTAEHGIAAERVIVAPRMPLPKHFARLCLADLALDAPPYGSHTTAADALWVGTPHLALRGEAFAARVSASMLTAIGLPELIADNLADYRAMALRLASDRAYFAVIRARLAANRLSTPLFDSRLFVRHLEAGYEAIWRRCREGQKPDHINVPAQT